MSFRARLLFLCIAIVVLAAALVLGILFSQERLQARTAGKPLLGPGVAQQIDGIDIIWRGTARVTLRRQAAGWEARTDGRVYPASAERITIFLRTIGGLTRGRLASRDPGHFPELGLGEDSARRLILHRAGTGPDLGLLVGKRGPSGDEDYVMVSGEKAAYFVRGSLAFFLAQDPPSWYELHVLPDDVQGDTIDSITVSGSLAMAGTAAGVLQGPYTLSRGPGQQPAQWSLKGDDRPANRIAASAMASALAMLEGEEFADPAPEGAGQLAIEVTTREGRRYSLSVRPGGEPGKALVTTSWSPWTYIVNELPLRRAVLPRASLQAPR
jgi:hypothetical protein